MVLSQTRVHRFSRDKHGRFGYFGFTPSWLQWLNNPWYFLAGVTLLTFGQVVAIAGFLIMLMPQIEKRFNLTGFDSGMIFAANDFAAVIFGLIIAHYGNFGNKVKWIGIGGIISGIGFLIFTLPHFIIGRYNPPLATLPHLFCLPRIPAASNGTTGEQSCAGEIADWYYLALFLIGQFVSGLGSISIYALSPACFKESTKAKNLPVFVGLWQAAVFVGPLFTFAVSKPLLKSYVDITQPDGFNMTPMDPRWISNWWVGFLGSAGVCFLSSFFILGFPAIVGKDHGSNDESQCDSPNAKTLREKLYELPSTLKDILTNWPFLFNCMGINMILMYIEGLSPFLAKLLILKYGVDPSDVGEALTISSGPPLFIGFLFSIILTRSFRVDESGKRSALCCFICQVLSVIGPLAFVISGCDTINLAGWEVPYGARAVTPRGINFTKYPSISGVKLGSTCNQHCGCDLGIALPVCGSDNITYLSPCYAGCSMPLSLSKFGNCSCIGPANGYGGTATIGFCDIEIARTGFFF